MLASILTIVKKAAMLAVYDEMTIKAKNHLRFETKCVAFTPKASILLRILDCKPTTCPLLVELGRPYENSNIICIQVNKDHNSLRKYVASLLHNRANCEPNAILHIPDIF